MNEPPLAAVASSPDALEPAGFWVRGGAVAIDSVLIVVASAVLGGIAGAAGAGFWTGVLIGFAVRISYHTVLVGRFGQTVGKMAAGVRVLDAEGDAVSYPQALGRALAYQLAALMMGLGVIAAAFMPQKRGLHDYMAGTRVVFLPGTTAARRTAMTVLAVLAALCVAAVMAAIFAFGVYLGMQGAAAGGANPQAGAVAVDSFLIRAAPKNPTYWNSRCRHRAIGGELDAALEDCAQSLSLQPSAEAYDSRGLVLLKLKRFPESKESYDQALALAPKNASSLYGRGLAREGLGDAAGRDADLAAARALDANIDVGFAKLGAPAPSSAPAPTAAPARAVGP